MTDTHWDRLQTLLDEALDLPPAERTTYLEEHCTDDALRREVAALLAADDEAGRYFERLAGEAGLARGTPDEPAELSGRRVGNYRLLEPIGRGGMGVVYLAERADGEFEAQVAIKLLPMGLAGSEGQRRFLAERQILATLNHPAIARLLDGGVTDDGTPYFVMERVRGRRIDAWCDQHELSVDGRIQVLCQVGDAVEYAHRRLIVHRDLKPANVLVTDEGAPKLLDFGVAKLLDDVEPDLTGSRAAPLTPSWAAPEQLLGGTITTATDTYALGALAHLLLTRVPVREPGDAGALRHPADTPLRAPSRRFNMLPAVAQAAVAHTRQSTPAELTRRLAGDLDAIVLRALDPDPERRYGSTGDLVADFRRYLGGHPVTARPPSARYRLSRFVARHRAGVTAAAVMVFLLVSLVAVSVQWALSSREQERRVAAERDLAEARRSETQAVQSFMENVLLTAQPLVGLGPDATILEGLDHIVASYGDRPVSDSPLVDARVRLAIGNVYTRLGRYDEAERLVSRAYEIRVRSLGPAHPEVADALFELGEIAMGRADFHAAVSLLQQAVDIRDKALDEPGVRTGHMLHRLGWARANADDLDGARAALERSVTIFRTREESADLADPLSVLGNVLRLAGSDNAEAVMREALHIRQRYLPPNHTKLGESYNNLAVLLDDQGRREEAAPLYRRAIEIQEAIYGPDSEFVAASLGNLGVLLTDLDRFDEAGVALERALAIDRATLGEDHLYVAYDRHNLARARCEGDQAGAGLTLAQAAHRTISSQSSEGWLLASVRSVIGLCRWRLGQLDRAEQDFVAALDGIPQELPDNQVNVATVRKRVERFFRETGRPMPDRP